MSDKVGVYLIGACGAVATTAVVGARAISQGLAPTTGLVTELSDWASVPLPALAALEFGGCEVRRATPVEAAHELMGVGGFLRPDHVEAARDELEALGSRIDPGLVLPGDTAVGRLETRPRALAPRDARAAVNEIGARIDAFKTATGVARVVVVNVASTEGHKGPRDHLGRLDRFEEALDRLPLADHAASTLYAYAALARSHAYLNFTPSLGSSVPALCELATRANVAHMGRDGKTGETLLKTTLAPMFVARHLRVLSWEGHNILGNRDGAVLEDPASNAAKRASKDGALQQILGDPTVHSRVRIDYCPSLSDWKTAWDFIHFEGFLGTRMILQLIWQGCDSILAAPLVLDLVRLLDHAHARGQGGLQPHLACFFKAPTGMDVHAFPAQVELLARYAAQEARVAAPADRAC